MAPDWPQKACFGKGLADRATSRKRHFAAAFLDFQGSPGFNAANSSERSIFSTRRPVPEAGGQRPAARCPLGRKRVWNTISSLAPLFAGRGEKGLQTCSTICRKNLA